MSDEPCSCPSPSNTDWSGIIGGLSILFGVITYIITLHTQRNLDRRQRTFEMLRDIIIVEGPIFKHYSKFENWLTHDRQFEDHNLNDADNQIIYELLSFFNILADCAMRNIIEEEMVVYHVGGRMRQAHYMLTKYIIARRKNHNRPHMYSRFVKFVWKHHCLGLKDPQKQLEGKGVITNFDNLPTEYCTSKWSWAYWIGNEKKPNIYIHIIFFLTVETTDDFGTFHSLYGIRQSSIFFDNRMPNCSSALAYVSLGASRLLLLASQIEVRLNSHNMESLFLLICLFLGCCTYECFFMHLPCCRPSRHGMRS